MKKETLIAEYERLRRLSHELDRQSETVDRRLVEIEWQLPKRYMYPGDVLPVRGGAAKRRKSPPKDKGRKRP